MQDLNHQPSPPELDPRSLKAALAKAGETVDLRSGSQPEQCPFNHRVFLWAVVLGPFDSGGVCSVGLYLVYGL